MKLKKNKKGDIEIAIGIIIFNIIMLSNFVSMHYATDTYCIIESGFKDIAKNAFLWSGRPITAVVFYLADYLNLSMSIHIVIMACISIITLSMSVYILFKTIINLGLSEEKSKFVIVLMMSYTTVLNFSTMDLLVFAEMGILCLSVLFSVIAACQCVTDTRFKYLKMLFFAILSAMCYQATLNIYVPIALMLIAIKNRDNIKKAFSNAFFILSIYGIAIVTSMVISNIINFVIKLDGRLTSVPGIDHVVRTYGRYLKLMVIDTLEVGPKYWYIIIVGIVTLIYFVYNLASKSKKINLFYYVSILLSAILIPILPLIVQPENKQYLELRMTLSFGASIGIMLLYTICSIQKESKVLFKIVFTISLFIFIFDCKYIIESSSEMKATNLLDRNYADVILYKIEKYEKENDVTIKNIAIDYDTSLEFYYHGSGKYRCLNTKALSVDWAIVGVLKTFGNREVTRKQVPEQIHNKYFKDKNWTCYSEEQIVFEGDTMYICIY